MGIRLKKLERLINGHNKLYRLAPIKVDIEFTPWHEYKWRVRVRYESFVSDNNQSIAFDMSRNNLQVAIDNVSLLLKDFLKKHRAESFQEVK